MKQNIETIIKRLVRWAFSSRILIYRSQQVLSDYELAKTSDTNDYFYYVKREMIKRLVDKLLEDSVVKIENEYDSRIQGFVLRSKLYCIK